MESNSTGGQTVFSVAIDSFASLVLHWPQLVTVTGAASVGLLGILSWAFGAGNMGLLTIVLLAMVLDLLVGAFKAALDPTIDFTIARLYGGFLGKIFRSLLIPTASLIDWLVIVSPLPLSSEAEAVFPWTMFVGFCLAGAELSSVIRKYRGSDVDPALLDVLEEALERGKAAARAAVGGETSAGDPDKDPEGPCD